MILRAIGYPAIFLLIFVVSKKLAVDFKYEDLKDYLGILSNVSAMVFTLMGIWIAFLYPNALARLVNPKTIEIADFSETLEDTRRLESIVGAVLKSAIVMICAMSIALAKIFIHKTGFYLEHQSVLKHLALSAAGLMSIVQLEAVMGVVFANVMFINDLHRKRHDKERATEV